MAPPSPDQVDKLLGLIYDSIGGMPDSRGNYNVECPSCGKGDRHFAYSERGAHCFVCGYSKSLLGLARDLNLLGTEKPPPRYRPRPTPQVPKTSPAPNWRHSDLWERYYPPASWAVSYYHSRGISNESIARWKLGCGQLPGKPAGCDHPRYILPVFAHEKLVALKGRRVDGSECEQMGHAKWLSAFGSETVLFNQDLLRSGATVIVTAAPYNAIKAMQKDPLIVAVAPSQGESTWREDWSLAIARSEPAYVVVWYDQDEAGRKGSKKAQESIRRASDGKLRVNLYVQPPRLPKGHDLSDDIDEGRFRVRSASRPGTLNPLYQPKPVAEVPW